LPQEAVHLKKHVLTVEDARGMLVSITYNLEHERWLSLAHI
jgi:hypothetical protein